MENIRIAPASVASVLRQPVRASRNVPLSRKWRGVVGEFIATTFFVYFACGMCLTVMSKTFLVKNSCSSRILSSNSICHRPFQYLWWTGPGFVSYCRCLIPRVDHNCAGRRQWKDLRYAPQVPSAVLCMQSLTFRVSCRRTHQPRRDTMFNGRP